MDFETRTCQGCGTRFIPHHWHQTYHSAECAKNDSYWKGRRSPSWIVYQMRLVYGFVSGDKGSYDADLRIELEDPDPYWRYDQLWMEDGTDEVREMLAHGIVWAYQPGWPSRGLTFQDEAFLKLEHGISKVPESQKQKMAPLIRKPIYITGGAMARSGNVDAKRRARDLADLLTKTGIQVNGDGTITRLAVVLEGKHWKIRNENGSFIYSYSTTPSDIRSMRNVESQLRRMNIRWGTEADEVLTSRKDGAAPPPEAQAGVTPLQERAIAIRGRLVTLREAYGATNTDLVRIGLEAAKRDNIWGFKTLESGVVQIGRFLIGKTYGEERSLAFYELIANELAGSPLPEPVPEPTPETLPEPIPEPTPAPAPEPTPDARPSAAVRSLIEEREREVAEARAETGRQSDQRIAAEQRARESEERARTLASTANELERMRDEAADQRDEMERQRDEARDRAIEAGRVIDGLRAELAEARTAPPSVAIVTPEDPLYIRALRRLVSASSTEDEIRDAFEMAMMIFRNDKP